MRVESYAWPEHFVTSHGQWCDAAREELLFYFRQMLKKDAKLASLQFTDATSWKCRCTARVSKREDTWTERERERDGDRESESEPFWLKAFPPLLRGR